MDKKDQFLAAIQEILEDDFSKHVVIPLFKSLGYKEVHFHGGPNEGGKDIIAWKEDPLSGPYVDVIQSKKESGKGKKSKQKLEVYLAQLSQALKKKIPNKDGREYLPKTVYFATPYEIDTRSLESQFESIQSFDGKISVVDGSKIYDAAIINAPDIIERFSSPASKISPSKIEDINNIELLRALNTDHVNVDEDWYSDLNFFVGNADSDIALQSEITCESQTITLTPDQWAENHTSIRSLAETGSILDTEAQIVESYNAKLKKHTTPRNKALISLFNETQSKATVLDKSIRKLLDELISMSSSLLEISTKKSSGTSAQKEIEPLIDKASYIKGLTGSPRKLMRNAGHIDEEIKGLRNSHPSFNPTLMLRLIGLTAEAKDTSEDFLTLESSIHPSPDYMVRLDGGKLCGWWNENKIELSEKIKKINSGTYDEGDLRDFINFISRSLRIINSIISISERNLATISITKNHSFDSRLKVSAHKVFDSGVNVAVYGEAGAGKTTTLQVYARRKLESAKGAPSLFYFPMNRIVSRENAPSPVTAERQDKVSLFFFYLLAYKNSLKSESDVASLMRDIKNIERPIFVFDGLDEAIKQAPWIIETINELPSRFNNCQVIVSSRDCTKDISKISFIGLTLLPFSETQLHKFVTGWINDRPASEKLISHITNANISSVIRNPLLATTVCSIFLKGIDIPTSEIEIYKKRVRLLCGMYDTFKDVRRTKSSQDDLEEAAKAIAFSMHKIQVRHATRDDLLSHLLSSKKTKFLGDYGKRIVEELIDPCNLIQKVPFEERYSFGHLRFQEHLAAESISTDRSFDILRALREPWWAGSLYLYAMENHVDSLLEDTFIKYGAIGAAESTLRLMFNARPRPERDELLKMLDGMVKQDNTIYTGGLYEI